MAGAAKAIDKGLAARDSFGGCLNLEVRNRRAAGMLLDRPNDRQRSGERHRDGQHGRSPTTPHFTNLFLIRQARAPDHTSAVAAASIVVKPRMLAIAHHRCSSL